MKLAVIALLVGCSHAGTGVTNNGSGGGGGGGGVKPEIPAIEITSCETAKPKIEALYKADAETTMPGADKAEKRAEIVADNTQMVLNDCVKTTATAVPCLKQVMTVADMEAKCLIPLDDEGTEGDALKASKAKEKQP